MGTYSGELFDSLSTGTWITYTGYTWSTFDFDNSWDDPYTEVDLTTYITNAVPDLANYIGVTEVYVSQLF